MNSLSCLDLSNLMAVIWPLQCQYLECTFLWKEANETQGFVLTTSWQKIYGLVQNVLSVVDGLPMVNIFPNPIWQTCMGETTKDYVYAFPTYVGLIHEVFMYTIEGGVSVFVCVRVGELAHHKNKCLIEELH